MSKASPFRVTSPFVSRAVTPRGVKDINGHRIKMYDVTLPGETLHEPTYASGLETAAATLPIPACTESRPGVGFAIRHQGATWDYVVLSWWDSENELPLRVFSRPRTPQGLWQPARQDQSVSVWDLEILAFERDAYVRHVLNADGPDLEAYLGRQLQVLAAEVPPATKRV